MRKIAHVTQGSGVLRQDAEGVVDICGAFWGDDLDSDVQWLCARLNERDGLWMTIARDDKSGRLGLSIHAMHQCHRLGCRRGFIKQRCIGERHAGEVNHHLLVGQKRLQPAL